MAVRPCVLMNRHSLAIYSVTGEVQNESTDVLNNKVDRFFPNRYSFTSSMDNCHLGDKMLRQLDIFQDLVPDRDCDVFARNELSQPGCQPAKNWDTGEDKSLIFINLHSYIVKTTKILKAVP